MSAYLELWSKDGRLLAYGPADVILDLRRAHPDQYESGAEAEARESQVVEEFREYLRLSSEEKP